MGQCTARGVMTEDAPKFHTLRLNAVLQKSVPNIGPSTTHEVQYSASIDGNGQELEFALSIHYERTVFSGDITYEYTVSCSAPDIASWTTRLTLEDLTNFTSSLKPITECAHTAIPNQYGKVMRSHTFTECLQRILDIPNLLRLGDSTFNDQTATLLSIPYLLRPIIQYDARKYDGSDPLAIGLALHQTFGSQYEYLSSCSTVPPSSALNRCYSTDLESECTSHWIRVLPSKSDLFIVLNCTAVYVVKCDFIKLIVDALLESVRCVDCAWIIADYLPKQLRLNQTEELIRKWEPPEEGQSSKSNGDLVDSNHALCAWIYQIHCAEYQVVGPLDSQRDSQSEYLEYDPDSTGESSSGLTRLEFSSTGTTATGIGSNVPLEYLEMGSSSDGD
jgi:hypothetical protein